MTDLLAEVLTNPIVNMAGAAIGVAAIALWLAAAWWVHADAGRRTDSDLFSLMAAGWILLSTPLMLPLALAAYRLARPQQSAADERADRLIRQLNLQSVDAIPTCPGCSEAVEASWVRCPACTTWLAAPCEHCGAWSAADLEICPFCSSDTRTAPGVASISVLAAQEEAAATEVAAAVMQPALQPGRILSSMRPSSYAASRETSSASS